MGTQIFHGKVRKISLFILIFFFVENISKLMTESKLHLAFDKNRKKMLKVILFLSDNICCSAHWKHIYETFPMSTISNEYPQHKSLFRIKGDSNIKNK